MKKILLLLFLFSCTHAFSSKKIETETKIEKQDPPDKELCVCMEIYQPVCGRKDKVTYANSCEADCQNVKYTKGACSDY
jgi:hypothetical protein